MRRFGPVQLAIITLLTRGARDFNDIVKTLSSASIPKSSIYTAINELRKKGILDIEVRGNKRIIKLKTDLSTELLNMKSMFRGKTSSIVTLVINMLRSNLIDYEELDPEVLEAYRDTLREQLGRVEEVLKKWRTVKVE